MLKMAMAGDEVGNAVRNSGHSSTTPTSEAMMVALREKRARNHSIVTPTATQLATSPKFWAIEI